LSEILIYLDPDSKLNLQNQIRQKLVDGILGGAFPPGYRLPSSRKLAVQLDVARNTVVLAYQQLIAEGYLVSRQRSGIFVNEQMLESRVGYGGNARDSSSDSFALWKKKTRRESDPGRLPVDLPNWHQYPFPFIDGKFDASLFPVAEWREASRLALGVADVRDWSTGRGDADDPMLLEEVRSKILTRRGIHARSDQILITMGTQHSLYLVSQLLTDKTVSAAIEEPGNTEMRLLLEQNGAAIVPQPVDEHGLVVDEKLAACDLVYVTPSHQIPTAVAMSKKRRQELLAAAQASDFVIVEDDYECEVNYLDRPEPALRSMDETGRVIYIASLSKVLAPGVRLGFIVADSQFIQRARALRRTMLNHPPLNNQRTTAYFLSLGHYDALMMRLGRTLKERRLALRDALNWMRGVPMEISPEVGGTTYWVRTPEDFDVDSFARSAAERGILIEPVSHYYADKARAEKCFRMGVTSLPIEKIRPGVERLVKLIRSQVKSLVEHLTDSEGTWMTGSELEEAMAGATVLYREVYGAPCTIRYHRDGTMTGVLGFSNEERQWSRWNYGEEKGYFIVLDGDQIKWFNSDRQLVDSAYISRAVDSDPGRDDLPAWSITEVPTGPM
jgi:GntR family transcriptional regulator/MocR family aminotransferase